MRMIGMGRSKNRNIHTGLCPGYGMGAVGMHNTANIVPGFVEERMGFRIR